MRDIRVDITGATDASGNFSQTIRLDKTDEWRVVKVAIGTTGPAEWALTTSGTPLTYGRGRRVTLGPELLQPFDTLTVSCISGPPNVAISGSCVGKAGDEREIITAYSPAPNTIALDAIQPGLVLGSVSAAANASGSADFVVPTGTQSITFVPDQNSGNTPPSEVSIVGDQTGGTIFDTGTGGHYPAGPVIMPVDAKNTSFTVTVKASVSSPAKVWLFAQLAPAQIVIGNTALNPVQVLFPVNTVPTVDVRGKFYDWSAANQFNNATASLTGATPPAGKTAVLAAFSCKVAVNAATSVFVQMTIKDGAGVLLWSGLVSIPATSGSSDYQAQSGLAVPASVSASPITISIGAIGVNMFADLAIGGYFV